MKDTDAPDTSTPSKDILTSQVNNRSGGGEGIDRKVEKKTWTPKRIAMIAGILLFVAAVAYGLSTTTGGKRLNVDREKITVATVERGPFQEYISQTGNVTPRTIIYLDAVEGGRVEEIFVREGATVEQGQPIVRLSNSNLQLSVLNAEASRIEQTNRLEQMRFQIEQNNLNMRQQLTDMNYEIQRLRREYERNKELHDKQLISDQEFERIRDEYEYYQRRRDLTLQSYRADSIRQAHQLDQMQQSLNRLDQNFELVEQRLDNLTIRAPRAGELTSLNAEVGEIRSAGFRFGQIDVLSEGYKVRAGIDEFYITRVNRGQTATTQPIAGTEYRMRVIKVFPEVTDGRFEVDLEFVGDVPEEIRRGQTIRFRLELGDPAEATLLPRGGFYQTTGGNWVYVVDSDGEVATKRSIRLGRQNPQYFEVLGGLEPGERVVTSSYDTFGDADRLVLN